MNVRCMVIDDEEIARRVGVTANYARVLMVRAVERLRNELGDEHD